MGKPISALTPEVDPPAPDPRRWLVLAVLGSAFFIVILDGTIVLCRRPADPSGVGVHGSQRAVGAEQLSPRPSAASCCSAVACADLLGTFDEYFMIGIALFTAASLLCGLAWSGEALIAFRVAQGAGAAIMALRPALSLVLVTFAEGPERNRALGIWAASAESAELRVSCSAVRSPPTWVGSGSSS